MDARFRAAGDHDVCVAKGNEPRGVADGVGAGGARCGGGMVGALQSTAQHSTALD